MRDILSQSNLDLLREIERLIAVVSDLSVPHELLAYQKRVLGACRELGQFVRRNLDDLALDQPDTFADILSQTQALTTWFRVYNQRIASALIRHRPSDLLSLCVIAWLHEHHSEMRDVPAALSDGEFGIWPALDEPIVYFLPSSRQHGLLYLPLFFHEFGHLLYARHRREADDLVRDLQDEIANLLDVQDAGLRTLIVERWYEWAQELFCDAVGLSIGGPCYAHAFSMYLRVAGRGNYHLEEERIASTAHPVARLRIRLLADRARRMGLAIGAEIELAWDQIAETLGVDEDYYGFYDPAFLPCVRRAIDDLLVETSPYRFTAEDVSPDKWQAGRSSPVRLLNRAWSVFSVDPDGYVAWEQQTISSFLG